MICKLRPSVHAAPMKDGVSFHNWDDSFVIRGNPALHTLFRGLLPALEQGEKREAIVASAPPKARKVAAYLIDQLAAHNMVLDLECLSVRAPSEQEMDRFGETVSYLESLSPDPYAAFERFRKAQVVTIGTGQSHFALARALTTMGLERVRCWSLDGDPCRDRLCHRLGPQTATPGDVLEGTEGAALLETAGGWDLLVHVEDGVDKERIERVGKLAHKAGALLQGVATPELGAFAPSSKGKDLGLALSRLVERGHLDGADQPSSPVSPVLAALVGNLVALEAFGLITGLDTRTGDGEIGVVRVELLESTFHRMEPGFQASPVEGVEELESLLDTFRSSHEEATPGVFLEESAPLTDSMLGLLPEPHPERLPQVPLNASVTEVVLNETGVYRAFGFGPSEEDARYNALVEGLKALAWGSLPVDRALGALRLEGGGRYAEYRADPSRLVMAAGRSYAGWLADGLRRSLLDRFAAGDASLNFSVSMARFEDLQDPLDRKWWKILALMLGRNVSLRHAVSEVLPDIHIAEVAEGGRTLFYGTGATREEALADALVGSVARVQAEKEGYSPPAVLDLTTQTSWAGGPSEGWIDGTLEALKRSGFLAIVRPLRSEPIVHTNGLLLGLVGVVRDG